MKWVPKPFERHAFAFVFLGRRMMIAASIGVGALVAVVLFRAFFRSFTDFIYDVRLAISPWFVDVFLEEVDEGVWAHSKVVVYLALSVGSGFLAYYTWFS
jgi:hypothetical protein